MQLKALLLVSLWLQSVTCKALSNPNHNPTHQIDRDPPIKRLFQVFGASDHESPRKLQPPPQYMLDLYKSIADESGLAKAPKPYNANVIRSFTDNSSIGRHRFYFNISGCSPEEKVLEAELHLYLLKNAGLQPHVIYIYQITDPEASDNSQVNRLVDVRYVSGPMEGWQVFRVQSAVNQWISGESPNHGLAVVAFTASGQRVSTKIHRWSGDRHPHRRPLLVLFNDDGTKDQGPPPSTTPTHEEGPFNPSNVGASTSEPEERSRQRRDMQAVANNKTRTHHPVECHRREMYVDFESIGWSEWIIAPKGYNAYHCSGVCTFPLGQSQRPTNHATVQSIIHEMNLSDNVSRPCCVPSRLLSLSLLYYDENDNVVLKQYGEMVADSCGCH